MVRKLHIKESNTKIIKDDYKQDKYNEHKDEYKGMCIRDVRADRLYICLLVDNSHYSIGDIMKGGYIRIYEDWVDRKELLFNRPVIDAEGKQLDEYPYFSPDRLFVEPTQDEIQLVRLLRKTTNYPNGKERKDVLW